VLRVRSHWTRKTSRDLTAGALKYHPLARLIKPAPLKLCDANGRTTSAAQLNILTLRGGDLQSADDIQISQPCCSDLRASA
jgi:hypothetical protein